MLRYIHLCQLTLSTNYSFGRAGTNEVPRIPLRLLAAQLSRYAPSESDRR
jgi:hypothetical protein